MKVPVILWLALAGLATTAPAVAQESAMVAQARSAGQVGERYDGYLGFVGPNASAELRRQVSAINIRRRSLYSGLATRKGVTPEEVGITAACSLLRRIRPGEYYLSGQGTWTRNVAGRSPVPSYCV
jgi:uncharacterized protein YdbL (DUF1318 family)